MLRFLSKFQIRKISHSQHINSVERLKQKAIFYLENHDTALACENSFEGCKLAMIEYVRKLQQKSGINIVPENRKDVWNYNTLSNLRLIIMKFHPHLADDVVLGWAQAYFLHVQGSVQNNMTVEEIKDDLPDVLRFMEIFSTELQVNEEMAVYLKENLFTLNLHHLADKDKKDS